MEVRYRLGNKVVIQDKDEKSEGFHEVHKGENNNPNVTSPTILMRFSKNLSSLAVDWLEHKITSSRKHGGCELIVEKQTDGGAMLFFISASSERILKGADEIGVRKKYNDGSLRDFSVLDCHNFKDYKDGNFFLGCEKLRIITQSLEGLRADQEKYVPGHHSVPLYQGKSIVYRMLSKGLMTDFFPLHDLKELEKAKSGMYKSLQIKIFKLPLDAIQGYYGDSVATYFAFLNYYLFALIWLVLLGVLHWVFVGMWDDNSFANSVDDNWMVSLMHLAWAVYLLEAWRRKSVEYAFKWGSLGMKIVQTPRMAYRGKLGKNPVTNKWEPQYPTWKRFLRVYLISMPIVFTCFVFAVVVMFYYFSWEIYVMELYKTDESYATLTFLPSVLYSILIQIANYLYHLLAEALTRAENHKYEQHYQNALILKILLFYFVNNFMALYYIAFVYRDMAMLRVTLRNLFLTDIAISQLMECVLPFINFKLRTYNNNEKTCSNKQQSAGDHDENSCEMSKIEQARIELRKDTYQSTFEEYLELWLQFGYVMLFACAYPPAAFFAIINNFIEQRTDSFKLCNFYRRPFARQCDGIDAWQTAFDILVYLSIISNLALIFFSPRFFINFYEIFPEGTIIHVILAFVVVEHLLLLFRFLLSYLIPHVPARIKIEMDKYQYRSRQLLKRASFFNNDFDDKKSESKSEAEIVDSIQPENNSGDSSVRRRKTSVTTQQ